MEQPKCLNASQQPVTELHDVHLIEGQYKLWLSWDGRPDLKLRKWEPGRSLQNDIPGLAKDYLSRPNKRNIRAKALEFFYCEYFDVEHHGAL